jgi:hypothetical protein
MEESACFVPEYLFFLIQLDIDYCGFVEEGGGVSIALHLKREKHVTG